MQIFKCELRQLTGPRPMRRLADAAVEEGDDALVQDFLKEGDRLVLRRLGQPGMAVGPAGPVHAGAHLPPVVGRRSYDGMMASMPSEDLAMAGGTRRQAGPSPCASVRCMRPAPRSRCKSLQRPVAGGPSSCIELMTRVQA